MKHAPDPHPSWLRVDDGRHDRTIEQNWLFTLRKERFRSRRSKLEHDFYVVHLADAVHVIALTPENELLLVRQFRAASGRDSLEVPGGLIDPGEDPLVAGARELLEETGHAGDDPELVGTLWSNPSLVTSRTTTIIVRNVRKVAEPNLDSSEELSLERVPADDVFRLVQEGRIDHALVVAGLLWWRAKERRTD